MVMENILNSWNGYNIRTTYRSLLNKFYLGAESECPHCKSESEGSEGSDSPLGPLGNRPDAVLVGGGTGYIGSNLVRLLKRQGYEVIVVSRYEGQGRITWDHLKDRGFPAHTKAVVNLAGQNVLDPLYRWNPAFKKTVYQSRIQSAKDFKYAIQNSKKKPEVFVQITGVGYYDTQMDGIQNEESVNTTSHKEDYFVNLVKDWESAAKLESKDTRNVWIRSGVVLGRHGGMIQQIFLPFYFGMGGIMGSGSQPMPWIHIKDLTGLILHSIENKKVKGVFKRSRPRNH